ncbi:MAG: DUF3782 domain-containing protein [Candidatus Brocadiae bacterium]|nr:DUF3782 domain-containing protein [Candidatus Brocadiia bacterium]
MTTLEALVEQNNKQIAEVWALFKETRENIERLTQKTDAQIERLTQKTDAQIERLTQKTDAQIEKTSKTVDRVTRELESIKDKWGRFVEYILAPGIGRVFKERNIPIERVYQRAQSHSVEHGDMEIDILGINHEYVIAVEVKSTLSIDDVNEFLEELKKFKLFFPEYKDRKVIGAVAGIEITGKADRYAYKKGLFVLGQAGEDLVIKNDKQFKPVVW